MLTIHAGNLKHSKVCSDVAIIGGAFIDIIHCEKLSGEDFLFLNLSQFTCHEERCGVVLMRGAVFPKHMLRMIEKFPKNPSNSNGTF